MKNSKTKSVIQQQMYVTVSERKVEKLKQLMKVFNDCLIDKNTKLIKNFKSKKNEKSVVHA
jgi:hypothetical protein